MLVYSFISPRKWFFKKALMKQKPLTAVAQETKKNHMDSEQGLYRSFGWGRCDSKPPDASSSSHNIQADNWDFVLQFCSHASF